MGKRPYFESTIIEARVKELLNNGFSDRQIRKTISEEGNGIIGWTTIKKIRESHVKSEILNKELATDRTLIQVEKKLEEYKRLCSIYQQESLNPPKNKGFNLELEKLLKDVKEIPSSKKGSMIKPLKSLWQYLQENFE